MKILIVLLALVIVFCGSAVFEGDITRYIQLQKTLKTLAEDCAEAAALCIDETASAEAGRPVIDLKRGKAAAEKILENTGVLDKLGANAQVELVISSEGQSGVGVRLIWKGPDIFRLSFIRKNTAERSAAYEWQY